MESNVQEFANFIVGIFVLILAIILYFLPSFNASHRKHNNSKAITILNLFLGWTLLGWVGALIWSFTDNVKKFDKKPAQN